MWYILLSNVYCLSWICNYNRFSEIGSTHYLYKEDNVNEVKWLEKYEYCRAKGDNAVYADAGQGKCEYSRGICYWDGSNCLMTNRQNVPENECIDLYDNNVLVQGLDNGRLGGAQVFPTLSEPTPKSQVFPTLSEPTPQIHDPTLPEKSGGYNIKIMLSNYNRYLLFVLFFIL